MSVRNSIPTWFITSSISFWCAKIHPTSAADLDSKLIVNEHMEFCFIGRH